MNVVIVGGHGKIGLRLVKLLAARGDSPRGIIRKTEQAHDLEEIGAEPIVLDIENVDDISDGLAGADAVVFAAGAGPGSGPARKQTVDYGGAVKLAEGCMEAGLDYTIVRPGGLTDDPGTGKVQIAERVEHGSVTRDDVAAVIAECLVADNTIGKAFDLLNDGTPISEAIRAL